MILSNSNSQNRRFFLKSSSACIALPILQSLSNTAIAQSSRLLSTPSASTGVGAPISKSGIQKRLVFLPMGYGVNTTNWFPQKEGSNYELPPLVESFAPIKKEISFIQDLAVNRIPGPHAATQTFLNCSQEKDKSTVSADQLAAELLGRDTRFDYLALGSPGRADGHGALPSYDHNGKPVGTHRSMSSLYAALFGRGSDPKKVKAQLARQESSLDALLADAKKLNNQVSKEDRDRVDEYFTSIRNVEKRLSKAQEWANTPFPKAPFRETDAVRGPKMMELIFDMMVIALQTDSTRVLVYSLPSQLVGIKNPHMMSHRAKGDWTPGKPTQHQARDLALAQQVANFCIKLKAIKEKDGTSILDNTLIAYGSCLRAGHAVGRGPLILAGGGGGGLKQGQNILSTRGMPLANLWLSMLRHVGINTDTFANSTGVIKQMGFS